eukprot:12925997-Alexandrium_andersonii.AAC.1
MPALVSTQEHYEAACRRCEIRVVIRNEEDKRKIEKLLRYDKRPDGARGRALLSDIPEMKLKAGDRLEPFAGLRDVSAFEGLEEFP